MHVVVHQPILLRLRALEADCCQWLTNARKQALSDTQQWSILHPVPDLIVQCASVIVLFN